MIGVNYFAKRSEASVAVFDEYKVSQWRVCNT